MKLTIERRHLVKTYFKSGTTQIIIGCTSLRSALETASKEYINSLHGDIGPIDQIEIYNKKGLVRTFKLS